MATEYRGAGGGGGVTPPSGAMYVFATSDQTVADANPQYSWIILAPAADTTAPTAPTGVTATAGNGQVALSWTASTDNVGVTSYRVYRGGTLVASPTTTSYTDTGLTNGTQYSYTVAAADAAGNLSVMSSTVTATPAAAATAPGQPTGLTATAGNAQASLSWTAPASNGGAAITDYVVQYRTTAGPGAWTTFADGTSTTTTATVTGLTNGTGYDFQVAAVNSVGTGSYSATASASPVASTTYVLDTFGTGRTSATTLGTPNTGPAWAVYNGGVAGVDSNGQAYLVSGTATRAVVNSAAPATRTVSGTVGAAALSVGLMLRAAADGTNGYFLYFNDGSYTLQLETWGGAKVQVAPTSPNAGQVVDVHLHSTGLMEFYYDGVLQGSITDTTWNGSYDGMFFGQVATGRISRFAVTA